MVLLSEDEEIFVAFRRPIQLQHPPVGANVALPAWAAKNAKVLGAGLALLATLPES